MNFDLSEDQAMLKALVERFGKDRYGQDLEARRRFRSHPTGFDRAGWKLMADMGLLAIPFGEADCGLGGGPVEIIAAAEPLGRVLAVEPFTECLVGSGTLLAEAAPDGPRSGLMGDIIMGRMLPAAALLEAGGRYNRAHVEATARRAGDGWVLNGAKAAVWHGMAADAFIVSVRTDGQVRDSHGIRLFLVPADAAGVGRRGWRSADGSVAAELVLRDVALGPDALLDGGDAVAAMDTAVSIAWLSASAEMLGAAGLLFDQTVQYVKTRVQFGQPIGRFQVIQHRLTDAYVALEQSRSMVYRAAASPASARARAVAGAKRYVADACLEVAHAAVQFHGGMGVTDELAIGHGLKRIQMLSRLWGCPETAADLFVRAA